VISGIDEALIIDGSEQPIQRLKDDATQRAHSSGRKKRHTLKAVHRHSQGPDRRRLAVLSRQSP
jgi:hypothetical protein